MITVQVDPAQIQDVRDRLAYLANGANRAISRALNQTASKAKTLSSRAIRSQVNLTAAYARTNLNGPANGWAFKATVDKLEARVSTPKRGILLRNFVTNPGDARPGQAASPIRVKVAADASPIELRSGFYVMTKTSRVLAPAVRNEILRRLGMTRTLDRGPFTVLHGPSLSQVFNEVKDEVGSGMASTLADNLHKQMDWLLKKYPPPLDDGAEESP